jgi:hypothetical protein
MTDTITMSQEDGSVHTSRSIDRRRGTYPEEFGSKRSTSVPPSLTKMTSMVLIVLMRIPRHVRGRSKSRLGWSRAEVEVMEVVCVIGFEGRLVGRNRCHVERDCEGV